MREDYETSKAEMESLNQDYASASRALTAIKSDVIMRRGMTHLKTEVDALESSVAELKAREAILVEDLAGMKKDLAKYQSTSL